MKQIERIVLTIPNHKWPNISDDNDPKKISSWTIWPINLCYLAAIIEPYYDVTILDANVNDMSEELFAAEIIKLKPQVVGISVLADELWESGHVTARIIKEIDPDITVVMGGIYATLNYPEIIVDKNIDYIVRGEGEFILIHLLDFFSGKKDIPQYNLVYRKDGQIVILEKATPIQDLDNLPLPAYHKIDFMKYANMEKRHSVCKPEKMPYGRIITSRGCPISCCFCQNEAIHGRQIRYRSPGNVLNEMRWLKDSFGIKSLIIDDANFTANRRRAKDILKGMIKDRLNISWKAQNLAVFTLDYELFEIIKESGCNYIDLPIESGVTRVLKQIIKKPVKLDHVLNIIKKAKELDFEISANFIIGFPGETWDEIRQTINFAEDIDIDYVKFMIATPYRYTRLYDMAYKGGYLREGFNFLKMRWGEGEIETEEFTAKDLQILRTYEWDRINFSRPDREKKIAKMMGISEGELRKIRVSSRKSLSLS